MDQFPNSPERAESFRPVLLSDVFLAAVSEVNKSSNPPATPDSDVLAMAQEQLGAFLPHYYRSSQLDVTGLLYDAVSLDEGQEDLQLLTLQNAQLKEITIVRIGEENRVVFRIVSYEPPVPDEHDGIITDYYLLPDTEHVFDMEFALDADTEWDPETWRRLQEVAAGSRDIIEDEYFANTTPEERTKILRGIIHDARIALFSDMPPDAMDIHCLASEMYALHEGAVLKNMDQYLLNEDTNGSVVQFARGDSWKLFFPETEIYAQRDNKTMDDFAIGRGTPCLSLTDEEQGYTYWIPLHAIEEIGWPAAQALGETAPEVEDDPPSTTPDILSLDSEFKSFERLRVSGTVATTVAQELSRPGENIDEQIAAAYRTVCFAIQAHQQAAETDSTPFPYTGYMDELMVAAARGDKLREDARAFLERREDVDALLTYFQADLDPSGETTHYDIVKIAGAIAFLIIERGTNAQSNPIE